MQSQPRARGAGARLPVLFVDTDIVEWSSVEGGRVAQSPVEGQGPKAVAEAVSRLRNAHGERAGACILALGSGYLRHKLLALPELSRREARAVLQRKAAHLAECEPENVAFAAVDFGATSSGDARGARTEHRWLLAAMQRVLVRDLCVQLRANGLRVRRIVSAHLASLAAAHARREDVERTCIVVSAHHKTTSVTVISGEGLASENVLEGNVRTQPTLAMSIVQEIRSNDAAWRKAHRGGAIEEVVLLGLPAERLPLFKNAVQTALPNARVSAEFDVGPIDPESDPGRVEMLAACRLQSPFSIDLSIPLPPRTATIAASLALTFGLVGAAGLVGFRTLRARETAERAAWADVAHRTGDLESLRAQNDRLEARLKELADLTARNEAVLKDGWDLRHVLGTVLHAFSDRAQLTGATLGSRSDGAEVQIVGSTSREPALAIENVDHIARELESGSLFGPTSAEPAGGVPDGRDPITFTLKSVQEPQP